MSSFLKFLFPVICYPAQIEHSVPEVPFFISKDLNIACPKAVVHARHGSVKRNSRIVFVNGIEDNPEAGLMILQPSLKIRKQDFEQILFGFVEVAEVCAPGYFADGVDR
ncbi:MAG: hypothetical protein M3N54_05280 [Acidobacteriota bacterium]|nr:hypothetical protein [Acidobacteriota bacterium]